MNGPDICGYCVCGGSPRKPNPDCERCLLVQDIFALCSAIAGALRELRAHGEPENGEVVTRLREAISPARFQESIR